MHTPLFAAPVLVLSLALTGIGVASAQTASPASASSPGATPAAEPMAREIRLEDRSNIIQEVRMGGQTMSIDVTPKDSVLPTYQVQPVTGERTWKVLGF